MTYNGFPESAVGALDTSAATPLEDAHLPSHRVYPPVYPSTHSAS